MQLRKPEPITCVECKEQICVPCGKAAPAPGTMDYKARHGLCKDCHQRAQYFDTPQLEIPRIFHWVWVGENPFPEKDMAWLQSWRTHHPGWKFVIWCEHPKRVKVPGFTSLKLPPMVNEQAYRDMAQYVNARAVTVARSDLVRYEVVARYGGIYLDTDVECFAPIDRLLDGVKLFLSNEIGQKSGNYMFGATPNHPALWTILRELPAHLRKIAEQNAQSKKKVNTVFVTGPKYLGPQLRKYANDLVIFPDIIFNPLSSHFDYNLVGKWPGASVANHHYDGKWYDRTKKTPPAQWQPKGIPAGLRPIVHRNEFPQLLNELGLLGIGVEIGVSRGINAEVIRREWKGKMLTLVDRWKSSPEYVCMAAVPDDKHEQFYAEVCGKFKGRDDVTILRLVSAEAARNFQDGELDWVYIDADHSYEAVTADVEAWAPKVKSGGILAGHDYENGQRGKTNFGVKRAVDEWALKNGAVIVTSQETTAPSWYCFKP